MGELTSALPVWVRSMVRASRIRELPVFPSRSTNFPTNDFGSVGKSLMVDLFLAVARRGSFPFSSNAWIAFCWSFGFIWTTRTTPHGSNPCRENRLFGLLSAVVGDGVHGRCELPLPAGRHLDDLVLFREPLCGFQVYTALACFDLGAAASVDCFSCMERLPRRWEAASGDRFLRPRWSLRTDVPAAARSGNSRVSTLNGRLCRRQIAIRLCPSRRMFIPFHTSNASPHPLCENPSLQLGQFDLGQRGIDDVNAASIVHRHSQGCQEAVFRGRFTGRSQQCGSSVHKAVTNDSSSIRESGTFIGGLKTQPGLSTPGHGLLE